MASEPTQLLIWGEDGFEACEPTPKTPKPRTRTPKRARPSEDSLFGEIPQTTPSRAKKAAEAKLARVGESAFSDDTTPPFDEGYDKSPFTFEKSSSEPLEGSSSKRTKSPQLRASFKENRAQSQPRAVFDMWSTPASQPARTEKLSRQEAEAEVEKLLKKAGRVAKVRQTPDPVFNPIPEPIAYGEESTVDLESFDFPDVEEDSTPKPKKKPARSMSVMARALARMERQECSRQDLERYLGQFEDESYTPEAIAETLDQLENWGYLSDQRFAEMRVQTRLRQWGNYRMRLELREHGISESIIESVLGEVEVPEIIRCHQVWQKRFQSHTQDRAMQERQIRYLATRGFSMSTILQVVRNTESYRMELENWESDPERFHL